MGADEPNIDRQTLLDAVRSSLSMSLRSPDGVAPAVAILWTDPDRQWLPLLPALKRSAPEIYELGLYDPGKRSGPAIWLKCVVERKMSADILPPLGVTPVFYLPGVGRQDLRAGDDCRSELKPLIELQYRGVVWHQRNGRDWTIESFLTSIDTLDLDIAQDQNTRSALSRALPWLATTPVASLKGRRLEADDFDRLAMEDPIRDLLSWISEPKIFEERSGARRWEIFRSVCVREFGFNPEVEGPHTAASNLLHGGGKWDEVWRRFSESPESYIGVAAALRDCTPRDLFADKSRHPELNEQQERLLAKDIELAASLPHVEACERVISLSNEHGPRRSWVWARLGASPYAMALAPLARLAEIARSPIGGPSIESMAKSYADSGWTCDRAVIDTLNMVRGRKDLVAIIALLRVLYVSWLEQSAERFQQLIAAVGGDVTPLVTPVNSDRDTCIVFVDGLRFDVGRAVHDKLRADGLQSTISHRISPIPTVTATAKPLSSSASSCCYGNAPGKDFSPLIRPSGQAAVAARLREAMEMQGVDVLDRDELRTPSGKEHGGWTEVGDIDKLGHDIGALLTVHLESQVNAIVERIESLLECGWKRVRVVTDHGWLLLPGGLPKFELPPSVVETKWVRCAAVQGESQVSSPTYPWYWNPVARVACPPGISAFRAGTEYAHGGISLQESVTPDIVAERGPNHRSGKIVSVTWRGMRCRVVADTEVSAARVDLRLKPKSRETSIASTPKILDASGEASLITSDDHEGAAAAVVLLDAAGQVMDYQSTTVGGTL